MGNEFIATCSVFGIVPVFIESCSQLLSTVVDINITMYFTSCCINKLAALQVLLSDSLNFLSVMYVFIGLVAID